MTAAFYAVLGMTPWCCALIALLLAARRLAGGRVEAKSFCTAWLLLAVRMVLPFDFAPQKSPAQFALPVAAVQAAGRTQYRLLMPAMGAQAQSGAATEAQAAGLDVTALLRVLPWVWFAGVCLYLAWHIGAYLRWMRALRRGQSPVRDAALLLAVREAFGRELPVRQGDGVASPMLAGVLRPVLYLPRDLREGDVPYVLAHEAAHDARRDLLRQWVLCCAGAVQWFNPLAVLMLRAARADLELACDAAALRGRSAQYRAAYAQAVLHALAGARRTAVLFAGFSGVSVSLKVRFCEMLNEQKKKRGGWLCAAVSAAIVTGSLFVSCAPVAANSVANAAVSATPEKTASAAAQQNSITVPDVLGMQGEAAAQTLQAAGLQAVWSDGDKDTAAALPVTAQQPTAGAVAAKGTKVNLTVAPQETSGAQSAVSAAQAEQPDGLYWPVPDYTRISARFGEQGHRGTDLAAVAGTPVYATQGGTVTAAERHDSLGNYVRIESAGGNVWVYAHCKELSASAGDTVKAGQQIATVGSTGNTTGTQLHWELLQNGTLVDALSLFDAVPEPAVGVPQPAAADKAT